jgi:hypothetical protein
MLADRLRPDSRVLASQRRSPQHTDNLQLKNVPTTHSDGAAFLSESG